MQSQGLDEMTKGGLKEGIVQVFTGNNKGKTTTSLGIALRAVGNGMKVLMVQFIKGPWKSGEDEAAKRLAPDFEIIKGGKGFVGILGDSLPRNIHEEAARKTLETAREAVFSGKYDLVILDEVNVALQLGLIPAEEIIRLIEERPIKVGLVLTGRNAPKEIIELADIVTEMNEVKHYYNEGKPARKGFEF